jgi:type I restriction enzyme R subunit
MRLYHGTSGEAFRPYYEHPKIGEQAQPQQMYELQARLDAIGVHRKDEVEQFATVFFRPRASQTPADHAKMNAAGPDPATAP